MSTAVLLGRVVLPAVFAVAAAATLADLEGSRAAVRRFGVPNRFVSTVAVALLAGELALAGTLLKSAPAHFLRLRPRG